MIIVARVERTSLRRIYNEADQADALPWHRNEPAKLLPEIIKARDKPGQALDIGCGSGVDSVFLAQNGWDVTSLDFMRDALRMTSERAEKAGVEITTIEADALEWKAPSDAFDLIVDIGCLHSKTGDARRIYRDKIISMLRKGGDYLLLHFEKRHPLDWRPIGPRRRTRAQNQKLFAPELVEKQFVRNTMKGPDNLIGSIMMGFKMSSISYWFRYE